MRLEFPKLLEPVIRQDIRNWSRHVLEVPNSHLGGMKACPYAEAAWHNDKVDVVVGNDVSNLKQAIDSFNPKHKDIVIWVSLNLGRYGLWDKWTTLWNDKNKKHDKHLMLFHPEFPPIEGEEEFLIDNEWESNIDEEYMMVFIQSLSFLNKASIALEKSGYYNYFSKDLYQSLVAARRSQTYGYG